jgi:hypothetical protein
MSAPSHAIVPSRAIGSAHSFRSVTSSSGLITSATLRPPSLVHPVIRIEVLVLGGFPFDVDLR